MMTTRSKLTRQQFFPRIDVHLSALTQASVRPVGVFGSVAWDEAGADSDVDIPIEFDGRPAFYDFAALRDRLSEIRGLPVDLTTPQTSKPRVRLRILDEVR